MYIRMCVMHVHVCAYIIQSLEPAERGDENPGPSLRV